MLLAGEMAVATDAAEATRLVDMAVRWECYAAGVEVKVWSAPGDGKAAAPAPEETPAAEAVVVDAEPVVIDKEDDEDPNAASYHEAQFGNANEEDALGRDVISVTRAAKFNYQIGRAHV